MLLSWTEWRDLKGFEGNCGGVEFGMEQASIEFMGVVVYYVILSNCCNRSQCSYGFNSTVVRDGFPSHQFPFQFMSYE